MSRNRFLELIERFSKRRVVLIGDFIADDYILCETSRVSREAPVLILQYNAERTGMGGALNVAANLAALGADVLPVGVVGDDRYGKTLQDLMKKQGISLDGLIVTPDLPTITKTRILACSLHTTMQQVLRIDRGEPVDDPAPHAAMVRKRALELIPHAEAVIVSDYGYGSIDEHLLQEIQHRIGSSNLIATADSRYHLKRFQGFTALTPNEPEVQTHLGHRMKNDAEIAAAGNRLLDELSLASLLITRGKRGMVVFDRDDRDGSPLNIPAYGSDEIADVTGAGDTVIATFTLALAAHASPRQAAILSNFAGGISVMKHGAAVVHPDELRHAVMQSYPETTTQEER